MTCSWFSICSIAFFWEFYAVISVPPTSTWSRVRRHGAGRRPLRSCARSSGLPELSPSNSDRVLNANNTLEITAWVSCLALNALKRERKTFLFLDDARRFRRVIASLVQLLLGKCKSYEALKGLMMRCEVRLFSVVSRPLTRKHPVGIVTNFPSLHGDHCLGWPQLRGTGDQLASQGPLQRDCPCVLSHFPMMGISGVRSILMFRLLFPQSFGHASLVPYGKNLQPRFP